jgi:uncharacterized membrane protein
MESVDKRSVHSISGRRAAIVLAALGLADSLYLTWIKLANATAVCAGIGDCELVNTSRYSEIAGLPIAAIGALAYSAILVLLLAEPRAGENSDFTKLGVFGFAFVGTLYSAYLTYVEIWILQAICPFCVASAVVITALLVISIIRLRTDDFK